MQFEAQNDNGKIFYRCEVCDEKYQHSHGIYKGKKLTGYDIVVCLRCYDSNWDGWVSEKEARIRDLLDNKGIAPPPRNAKGWLPREF